jgi:hypothetical protein
LPIANSFRVQNLMNRLQSQGRNPGLKFANAFGVSFHTVPTAQIGGFNNEAALKA